MKAIYIAQLPVDLVAEKDGKPGEIRMDGGGVYPSQFVTALIKHSRADVIIFPPTPLRGAEDIRLTDTFVSHSQRIQFLSMEELSSLHEDVSLVLLSTGWRLEELLIKRSALRGQLSPAAALTHSLCSPSLLNSLLHLRMAPAKSCDALVCSSRAGKRALETMFDTISERCEAIDMRLPPLGLELPIIPLAMDMNQERKRINKDNQACTLLYFGRLAANSKGDLRPVLVAFARLLQDGFRAQLTIAGDDTQSNLAPALEEFAGALGCGDHVNVIANPTSSDKTSLFRMADVFLSPSDSLQEQFGITLLEAMGWELPVIASNWSGYRDIVVHGETGFLVDTLFPAVAGQPTEIVGPMQSDRFSAATSVDGAQLMSYLRLLISDVSLRKRLGNAGRWRAQSLYNWERVIGMHDDLWDDLTARASVTHASTNAGGLQLERWVPEKIFGGFATQSWSADTRVAAGTLGSDMKAVICRSLSEEFEANTLLGDLLDRLQTKKATTLKELSRESGKSLSCLVHSLGILAKHGLIIAGS